MNIRHRLSQITIAIRQLFRRFIYSEEQSLMLGRIMSMSINNHMPVNSIHDVEFRVFSQFGDDGIIQWLINNIEFENKTFVEFGVEDYRESNTRFLLMNNNWSGFILDGSKKNISKIKRSEYFWKYNLRAENAFITKENINDLLNSFDGGRYGLLHIDIDGNDYWIWEEISINPEIVIIEYNSVFGAKRSITTPYRVDFNRTKAHYSNLYFGSSLKALINLSNSKGYAFIGCNSAGNNAYFVRRDKLNENIYEVGIDAGYVESKFRESRDESGNMTYLSGNERIETIAGLPVFNTEENTVEKI